MYRFIQLGELKRKENDILKITNFNPVILQGATKLNSGVYMDLFLLNNGRAFKMFKPPKHNNFLYQAAFGRYYNNTSRKLQLADDIRDESVIITPDEVAVDDEKYVKGFYYDYDSTPSALDFFATNPSEDEVNRFFLNLSNAVEKCHDKKVVAPDLNFGNILYDRNTGKISYIDYDGLQIGRVPTNVINSDIFYKQNPVLRKSKYSAPGGLYSKEIDTFSILVGYLAKTKGLNISSLPEFQKLSGVERDDEEYMLLREKCLETLDSIGINDRELADGYISLFSNKQVNPEPKKLIKRQFLYSTNK